MTPGIFQISSSAFLDGQNIPIKYTCDGLNINPPLTISNIPENTKSLVLILEDRNAPIRAWTHWMVWNIKPQQAIGENTVPGTPGQSDFKRNSYVGPCPLCGKHTYTFIVYALKKKN